MKLLLLALVGVVAARAKRTGGKTCRHHRRLEDLADAPAFNATSIAAVTARAVAHGVMTRTGRFQPACVEIKQ